MRFKRYLMMLIFATITALLAGGCSSGVTAGDLLNQKSIAAQPTGIKTEIRFLKESKGSNYMYVELSGDDATIGLLIQGISRCAPAEPPATQQLSPELISDCQIAFIDPEGTESSFYYVFQDHLLIYPEIKKNKDRETLRYLFYSDDGTLASLLQGQMEHARLKQQNNVKPFRSMEELKASIDPEELSEEGKELNFEFYAETTPPNTGTACSAYTFKAFSSLPNDSILVTTYGKTKTGEQMKLSVVGLEANSYYTRIIVQEPDEALDSVDTGDGDSPESHAILIQKSAIDLKNWIVFVDTDGNILDVIIPEDIEGIDEVIDTPVEPVENPDDGSGDGAGDASLG